MSERQLYRLRAPSTGRELLLPAEPVLTTPPPGVFRGERPEIFLWPANGPRDVAPGAVRSVR